MGWPAGNSSRAPRSRPTAAAGCCAASPHSLFAKGGPLQPLARPSRLAAEQPHSLFLNLGPCSRWLRASFLASIGSYCAQGASVNIPNMNS